MLWSLLLVWFVWWPLWSWVYSSAVLVLGLDGLVLLAVCLFVAALLNFLLLCRLPSRLFVGEGSACLLWQLVGAVAIGELASAGVAVAIGVSAIAFGGSCGVLVCAVVNGACSVEVCFSIVAGGLLGGWKTIGGCSCACDVGGGIIECPVMMSNICLSYLSGSACVWLFLLWQPCCQCQGEFLLLMCLFRAKLLWRTVVPFLEVVWLLGVDTELFLQTHRLELCGPCSICGSSLCCRPRVLRTCWVSTLCVVPSMVLLGVCWWLFCRSFVVIVLPVFWFVPSVFDGIVRRCLVLVSCM